jgi:hypothetical protein
MIEITRAVTEEAKAVLDGLTRAQSNKDRVPRRSRRSAECPVDKAPVHPSGAGQNP